MGLAFRKQKGTGLATCKLCNQKIKKGEDCIVVYCQQSSGQCHIKYPNKEE